MWYGEHLTRWDRFDEAIAEPARAVALDPVSPASYSNRGMIFFRARRYDEAIRSSQQALDLDPTRVNALWWELARQRHVSPMDLPWSMPGWAMLTRRSPGWRRRISLAQ